MRLAFKEPAIFQAAVLNCYVPLWFSCMIPHTCSVLSVSSNAIFGYLLWSLRVLCVLWAQLAGIVLMSDLFQKGRQKGFFFWTGVPHPIPVSCYLLPPKCLSWVRLPSPMPQRSCVHLPVMCILMNKMLCQCQNSWAWQLESGSACAQVLCPSPSSNSQPKISPRSKATGEVSPASWASSCSVALKHSAEQVRNAFHVQCATVVQRVRQLAVLQESPV